MLEDDDNEIFGTETLSITPDEAEQSTAKRSCVSKDWGEAEEDEETAGPVIKVVLQVTVKRKLKCMPLSNTFLKLSRRDIIRRNISLEFPSSEDYILRGKQLLAASATEKDCLLLGLLSGQMREIAVRLARSTTAAGQRTIISFKYRVHGEWRFHLCITWIDQAEEFRNLLKEELCILIVMTRGLAGKQHKICTYLM